MGLRWRASARPMSPVRSRRSADHSSSARDVSSLTQRRGAICSNALIRKQPAETNEPPARTLGIARRVAPPGPPQTRACRFPAPGSSTQRLTRRNSGYTVPSLRVLAVSPPTATLPRYPLPSTGSFRSPASSVLRGSWTSQHPSLGLRLSSAVATVLTAVRFVSPPAPAVVLVAWTLVTRPSSPGPIRNGDAGTSQVPAAPPTTCRSLRPRWARCPSP